jgi:4-aminobutyrate aminotransferase
MTNRASEASLSSVWAHMSEAVIDRAEGAYLFDSSGRRYLDFSSGIGVANTGHCHPRVVAAIRDQAARLIHSQVNIARHGPLLALVEGLRKILPENLDSYFFASSGAEAIEAAVKLARRAAGRPGVVTFQGSFHGRTVGTMSLTNSKSIYRAGYQPLMPGVTVAPYPYAFRYGWDAEEASRFCLRELRHLFVSQTSPEEVAAVLIEPVLGEGGYVPPPASFLQGVAALCRELGILLILDEVQTGFGRTGKFFAFEHFGIEPDILVMAKGLASGMPLSAIAASRGVMARWPTGSHGSTYSGNAVACAAAAATIEVLREEDFLPRAARMGRLLHERLAEVARRSPRIGDVRGLGLMIATEFGEPGKTPESSFTKAVQRRCLERGLVLLTCGTYGNVIRWIPPLVVTEGQIDTAVGIFADAVMTLAGS